VVRRILVTLTVLALMTISAGIGVLVADWPRWYRVLLRH
jgi:hypothetical protein